MTEAIEIKDTKMESLATISNDENGNQMVSIFFLSFYLFVIVRQHYRYE